MFINPPVDASQYPWEYGLGSKSPSMGLCSLAAYSRKYCFETAILDAYNLELSVEDTLERILRFSPTHIGITATTSYIFSAAKLAKLIKRYSPQIITIIGGAHISSVPIETMQRFSDFDIGVIGEGEKTIIELLSLSEPSRDLDKVNGIIYREGDDELKKTSAQSYLEDLDKLPYPAFDLLSGFPNYYRLSPPNYKKSPVAPLVTSRGCPYRCTFCNRSVFGNRVRSFSTEYVVGLIKELKDKYRIREIAFYDDTFTMDKMRLKMICESFLNNNLRLSWSCLSRVDSVDQASLKLMKRAGCWLISYGIESASQEILDLYQKKINLFQIEEAIRATKAQGIQARAFFMIGNPLENENTILQMKSLLRKLPLDDINISFFTPLPGSESYKVAHKYGKFNDDWDSMDVYSLNFVPYALSRDLLLKYMAQLYRSFYLRPKILLRYLKLILNPKRIFKTFKSGLLFLRLIS